MYINPGFAAEKVMRVLNTIQVSVSGYLVAEEIVSYLRCKKVITCLDVK